MSEFLNVQPVQAALQSLFAQWQPSLRIEKIKAQHALGRVVAVVPFSPHDLPSFRRSTMDGYALRAADTFGASQALPAYLSCIATIPMGAAASLEIGVGQAAEISTGGMLPLGADAVVMIEKTQKISADEIEVLAAVAVGENVIQIGEDVGQGDQILPVGQRIRPQDIGGLLAVGILEVEVALPPRVGIISSGDELVPPESTPAPGQIRDINAHTLSALIQQTGGEALFFGIARDTYASYYPTAAAALEQVDILLLTAGSSVSTRDLTREVIANLGQPGILQHGLAVKPGKPTLIGLCANKPVIGLPGNPVSAFLVAQQVVVPLIRGALGEKTIPAATVKARLAMNLASMTGREDRIPVRLVARDGELYAEPVLGKSNLIYTLVNADGWIDIPLNSNGLRAATLVDVVLF